MTPQDKAKELIYDYSVIINPDSLIHESARQASKDNAKECALLCVYEISKFDDRIDNEYWAEVRKQIQAL